MSFEIGFRDLEITDPVPPIVSLNCNRQVNNRSGLVAAQLEFSYTNVSLIHEAIENYVITVRNPNFTSSGKLTFPRAPLELGNVLVCHHYTESNYYL